MELVRATAQDLFSIFFLNTVLQDAFLFLSTYIFSCRVTRKESMQVWNLL